MANTPKKKATKPRKKAKPDHAHTSGHGRLVKVALGVLVLVGILVVGLIVFAPKTDSTTSNVAKIAVPPPQPRDEPSSDVPGEQTPDSMSLVQLPPMPDVAFVPDLPIPTWLRNAVHIDVAPGQPMIAVVIDDMGLDRARAQQTVDLPGPLTLAYLAYADDLAGQTAAARKAGHELLVHVPMEPGSATTDPGPNAVLTTLTPEELTRRMEWNLSQFSGFVGINNHMGSKATSDRDAMTAVMKVLKQKGMLFLDSRTAGTTVAESEAVKAGIPALRRDVFLDHDPSPIAVRAALLQVEKVAQRQGFAVAIGHPKDSTIGALLEWLPDVQARGFVIVPVSAIAKHFESKQ